MNTKEIHIIHTKALSYLLIALLVSAIILNLPYVPSKYLSPTTSLIGITLLFVLLVFLTARLARTANTGMGILLTGAFILLFNPGMAQCLSRNEMGLIETASQCMVPFFLMQFLRIRKKDFQRGYVLMFLMGLFCSYTHNGVAIPLCATFLWITWRHRERFFKRACWPMVIGFAIGTTLSIVTTEERAHTLPEQFLNLSQTTWEALSTLWDTKVFVINTAVTFYLLNTHGGRDLMRRMVRRHYSVCICMAFSLLSLPLAPLGIDNAVTGVCFFSMFWLLFIARYMVEKHFGKRM